MGNELAKLSFIKDIALLETIEEIKLVKDAAEAYQDLCKKQKLGKSQQDEIGDYIFEVTLHEAAWLEENFPHGGGRNFKVSKWNLEKMPITKKESARVRRLKNENETNPEIIESIKNNIKESKDIVLNDKSIDKELKKILVEKRIKEEKENRIIDISDIDIRPGDFKEVLKDVYEIDAIITDPPYPAKFINCFSELGLYAKEHLKNDGFCIVYSGQYNLPEVINRLSKHLIYVWTFCLYHVGKKQLVNGVNIMCGWKPVLIFSKGRKKMRFSTYDVLISESMEKSSHEWQQSESGVEKLIEIFTKPGELIVDPFSGSGTFLKVGNEMGRKTIGAEINDTKKI